MWAFTFVSFAEYTDAGHVITIEVTIDNPHMIQNLVDDWKFEIGAQVDATVPTATSELYIVEESITDPVITDGLITDTLRTNT